MRNKIIGALIFGLFFVHPVLGCFNPSDHFAAEVLLNKPGISYNLTGIKASENVTIKDGAVVYRSHYNPAVAVALSEVDTAFTKGLSVRIQIPTQEVRKQVSSVTGTIEEKVGMGDLRIFDAQNLGWNVVCTEDIPPSSCGLYKDNISLHLSGESVGVTKITLQVKDASVLDENSLKEISTVLRAIGLRTKVEEVKFRSKTYSQADLEPAVDFNGEFDFSLAMKVELEWLRSNGVIYGLNDLDIEKISGMSRAGSAGHNSRLVHDSGRWLPYARSSNPALLKAVSDCSEFPVTALPAGIISSLESSSAGQVISPPTMTRDIPYALIGLLVFGVLVGALLYKKRIK